jgi:hypothetical protein
MMRSAIHCVPRCANPACWCRWITTSTRGIVRRLRLFLVIFGRVARACEAYCEMARPRFALDARQFGGRAGEQRRLLAEELSCDGKCPCSGSILPIRSPPPRKNRRADPGGVLRRALAGSGCAGAAGRPDHRQQRARARAGCSTTSSPESLLLKPEGTVTIEFPHLLEAHRECRVRHDLSRALFVHLSVRNRASVRSPRTANLRCRGIADARRVAANIRLA